MEGKKGFQKGNNFGTGNAGRVRGTPSDEIRKKISVSTLKNIEKLGYKNSPETRKKLSIANTGKHLSIKTRKKLSIINKGKKLSGKTKIKMSKNNCRYWLGKKRLSITGKRCHLWKGGITSEIMKIRNLPEYRLWRKAVFERDNFVCQKTGISGGKLNAHHINNFSEFPELRFAIDNGITLSEKAHKEFHKKYGIKNNTKEQLLIFLNKIYE